MAILKIKNYGEYYTSKSIKGWGFIKNKDLEVDGFKQSINSDVVRNCIDKICEPLEKKTILLIENSPIQRSNAMLEKQTKGEVKGLTLWFLPT